MRIPVIAFQCMKNNSQMIMVQNNIFTSLIYTILSFFFTYVTDYEIHMQCHTHVFAVYLSNRSNSKTHRNTIPAT